MKEIGPSIAVRNQSKQILLQSGLGKLSKDRGLVVRASAQVESRPNRGLNSNTNVNKVNSAQLKGDMTVKPPS